MGTRRTDEGSPVDETGPLAGRVALVDASHGVATKALLADAAEALPVYARLAGTEPPELVRADAGADVARCDTVLLALALGPAAPRVEELPLSYAPAGARAYALLAVSGDPQVAAPALAALEERCEERDLAWRGGLAVGDADLLPRIARCPRMGWARRRVSEALDRLLIALLANQPAGEKYVRPSRYARITCR